MTPDLALKIGLLTPLAIALLTPFLAVRSNWRDAAAPLAAGLTFFAAIIVAIAVLKGNAPEWPLFSIGTGLGPAFRVTPLGALFGLVASGLWIVAAIYSAGYMRGNHEKQQTRFAAFYALAIHAAMAVAWSGNLLVLFIFYEILTFSTYPLVIHKQSAAAFAAGRLYMGILVGASLMLFMPAIVWVWVATGTLEFTQGGILDGYINPAYAPWLLALFAFGAGKAALMPLHRWLPAAMVAPTPVSALLHAVAVVKAGVFTILTIIVYIFGINFITKTNAAEWLVWLASFTVLAASIIAIRKDDLKARLAYSTVSQLAYIVLGAAIATEAAITGASLHIVMHASAKITLFFCAGAIYVATGINKVSELDGLGFRMPFVFAAFFIAALSIIGVPPLGGVWSKFFLMTGAAHKALIPVIIVLGVSTLLNVYYLLEPVMRGFRKTSTNNIEIQRHPLTVIPLVITALISVLLFFMPEPFFTLAAMTATSIIGTP